MSYEQASKQVDTAIEVVERKIQSLQKSLKRSGRKKVDLSVIKRNLHNKQAIEKLPDP